MEIALSQAIVRGLSFWFFGICPLLPLLARGSALQLNTACPFPSGSLAVAAWLAGWLAAAWLAGWL